MKRLLLLLILPFSLFAQQPPINQVDLSYHCSVEQVTEVKKQSKFNALQLHLTAKQEVDAVEYLLSVNFEEAQSYLRNWSQVGQTTMFSDQNVLRVAQYFKDNIIQRITPDLSDQAPSVFIEYFRAYDWHVFYQSEVRFYVPYIDALVEALTSLNNYEPYWQQTAQLNSWRWTVVLAMDIDKYRSRFYDLIILNLEKSDEYMNLNGNDPQLDHLSAISSLVWRGFVNNDESFMIKFFSDAKMNNLIFSIINNPDLKQERYAYLPSNFINAIGMILKRSTENSYGYNTSNLFNTAIQSFNQTSFGEYLHTAWIAAFINIDYNFGINFDEIKKQYFDLQFTNIKLYDDEEIELYSGIEESRIKSIYLDIRQTRASFFKLTGDTIPIANDPNDKIKMYIFKNQADYSSLGRLLFNIPTNNGGIYIERDGSFYTFDREDDYLPINFLVNHEYTHYLDGRYNIHGEYGELEFYDWNTGRYAFWVEGMAGFVGSAKHDQGFGIAYSNGLRVANDVQFGTTITLQESIRTSYSKGSMYAYSDAAWGFLYKHKYNELLELLELVKENNIQQYFNKLDQITFDQSLEPLYQEYLIEIKQKQVANQTRHNPLINYDFTQPTISNDSIQFAFENIGLNDFILEQSYINPYEYVRAVKDTIVSDFKEVHQYVEAIIRDSKELIIDYTGYKILTAQIDKYEKIDAGYKVFYSIELPINGKFIDNTPAPPVDPVDPPVDPVDPPVDPEPVITELTLYPNPSVSEINVAALPDASQVFIYDLNGRMLFNAFHRSGKFNHNVSNYSSGIYIFVYRSQTGMGSIKFIKR